MKKKNIWSGKNGPLMIAEIGGNHEGNFLYAKKLTKEAIKSGADVIKFQLYSGDGLVNYKIAPRNFGGEGALLVRIKNKNKNLY